MIPEPVTAAAAGRRLRRAPATIRQWARRYNALQLGTVDRAVFYEYADLATIDAFIHRGEPVPATPELRAEYRAQLRAA